jgi:DNA-binding HxlR family transcriptional regulator
VRYAPTEDGRATQPVIRALVEWGNRRLEQAQTARAGAAGE